MTSLEMPWHMLWRETDEAGASRTTLVRKEDQFDALDGWVAKQDDKPSRPEAIRRLVDAGLEATSKKGGKR